MRAVERNRFPVFGRYSMIANFSSLGFFLRNIVFVFPIELETENCRCAGDCNTAVTSNI